MHFHVWVGQYISITEGKMILAALAQFAVCFLILAWVLKKKTGEPYSRKAVIICRGQTLLPGKIGCWR